VNWKDYEIYITRHFQKLFPGASIQHDVRRLGLISKTERQIDILIEGRIAGFALTIVVDCKYFGKKVDVKEVDSFLGYLHDLKASKGILITNQGYTEAAYNRAMYDTRDVELRIIDFNDLEKYQGFLAIPYFGAHGAIVPAPDGWIIDSKPQIHKFHKKAKPGIIAALYPAGLSEMEAFHREGYIYFSYSHKDKKWPNLDHLLAIQEANIKAHYKNPRIKYEEINLRDDCRARVRHLEAEEMRDTIESTLFLDFPKVIIYINLLAPSSKHTDYLKKLYWIGEKFIKVNVLYDTSKRPIRVWTSAQSRSAGPRNVHTLMLTTDLFPEHPNDKEFAKRQKAGEAALATPEGKSYMAQVAPYLANALRSCFPKERSIASDSRSFVFVAYITEKGQIIYPAIEPSTDDTESFAKEFSSAWLPKPPVTGMENLGLFPFAVPISIEAAKE